MSNVLNFKNWVRVYEQTATPGGSTVKLLGDTGIKVVTFSKDTSFQAPDNKPYILLLTDDVSFQGAANVDITLRNNAMERQGAYKRPYGSEGEGSIIVTTNSPDLDKAVRLLHEIVTALYGGVTKDGVMKTVKAMKLIKDNYPTEIANNSLFTNLRKKTAEINNTGSVQSLYAKMGGKNLNNMNLQAILDGTKAAIASF
jgi:hypothetical protein